MKSLFLAVVLLVTGFAPSVVSADNDVFVLREVRRGRVQVQIDRRPRVRVFIQDNRRGHNDADVFILRQGFNRVRSNGHDVTVFVDQFGRVHVLGRR